MKLTFSSARVSLALTALAASVFAAPTFGQQIDARRAVRAGVSEPEIMLLVQQGSGEFAKWVRHYTAITPAGIRFRWSTTRSDLTSAEYQVLRAPYGGTLQRGVMRVPQPGKVLTFTIDFRPFTAEISSHRAVTRLPKDYWVRVVGYGGGLSSAGTPAQPRVIGSPVKISFICTLRPKHYVADPNACI